MILKVETIKAIKESKALRRALQDIFPGHENMGISDFTLNTWLRTNDKRLSSIEALKIIKAYLKKTLSEIADEEHEGELEELKNLVCS